MVTLVQQEEVEVVQVMVLPSTEGREERELSGIPHTAREVEEVEVKMWEVQEVSMVQEVEVE
jgi:hypothetical protein